VRLTGGGEREYGRRRKSIKHVTFSDGRGVPTRRRTAWSRRSASYPRYSSPAPLNQGFEAKLTTTTTSLARAAHVKLSLFSF